MDEHPTLETAEGVSSRFDTYDRIRAIAPIYQDPISLFFVVTNAADVRAIALDAERFSNKTNMLVGRSSASSDEIAELYRLHGYRQVDTLSSNDPPSHSQFRKIVDKVFRPARVSQMSDYMEGVINELIDRFEPAGRTEFIAEYATLLPITVIADQMGISRSQLGDFKRWSDAVMASANNFTSPSGRVDAARSIIELQQFLATEIERARAAPRDDIISDVATAEIDGRPLEMEEMISMLVTLLVAGNETTTNAIGSAMMRLIETGAESRLRDNPTASAEFTEEVLRLDAPIQLLYRRAKSDLEYGGVAIPKDAIVQLVWAAANRDPAQFGQPAEFRTGRGAAGAQHLTFGFGIHFCVGRVLARAEINATLRIVTTRLRNLRVADEPDAVVMDMHQIGYGPRRLVLQFDRA